MSEEEKKAIEQLKNINEFDIGKIDCNRCLYQEREDCLGCFEYVVKTILNLIKKQQKEIEKISSENYIGKRQYERLVNDYEELNQENIANKEEIEKLNKIKSKVENKVNELRNRVKYVASSENFICDEIADLLQELLEED